MAALLSFIDRYPVLVAVLLFIILLLIWALRDIVFQHRHAIQHNYPILGHFRYWLEKIGPVVRQYWVANDKEEMPFNRDERRWVYATAKQQNNTFGFGTDELIYGTGYPIIKHSAFPVREDKAVYLNQDPTAVPSLKVLGEYRKRRRPYRPASIVNLSGMSFGSLGYRAVSALNKGAKEAGCLHNTGEGAISPYHEFGADLVWQLGTAYFGARDELGRFSMEKLVEKVSAYPQVRAIEIKLSQGAKPGKGGILPGHKVTKEIAEIRGIPVGQDCLSPNSHSAFHDVDGLLDFIEAIADETGLPVGIKSAVGQFEFWTTLAKRMKTRKVGPDFIAIDGGEGGTGAAPLTFADHVSLPFKLGFSRVYSEMLSHNLADKVTWIGSAKLGFPDRAIVSFAMGCDMINVAREAMFSVGCIQARKCHTDHCPTGIATQNRWLQAGLNIEDKAVRAANYIKGLRKELLMLAHAAGYEHPSQFTGKDIEFSTGINKFTNLETVMGYSRVPVRFTQMTDYGQVDGA